MQNLTPEYKDKQPLFYRALDFILKNEGTYSDDKNDVGGETYCGISRKFHPSWDGWIIVDEAKELYPIYSKQNTQFNDYLESKGIIIKVRSFYYDNFWKILQLDKIIIEAIAIKIFDISVNMGVPHAAQIVQNSLNVMNYGINCELRIDNIVGPVTISLINELTKIDDGELLLTILTIQQGYIYIRLAQTNPSQREFIRGWINRLNMKVGE